jgi:DNA-binding FadR family transcriptional regulator
MIEPATRVDQLVTDLQDQILSGRFQPGERLPSERSLCTDFGVGRTTVREALKALSVGRLVTRTRRGAVVADPRLLPPPEVDLEALAAQASIRDLYEVRKLLEVQIARWAAMRATPADIATLRAHVQVQQLETDEAENYNRFFHDALVAAAHNVVLAQIYASGSDVFHRLPFFWQLLAPAEIKRVRASRHELARRWHLHVLKAIERRDPDEAAGAMFQHLDIMEKDLLLRLHGADGQAPEGDLLEHPMLSVQSSS